MEGGSAGKAYAHEAFGQAYYSPVTLLPVKSMAMPQQQLYVVYSHRQPSTEQDFSCAEGSPHPLIISIVG